MNLLILFVITIRNQDKILIKSSALIDEWNFLSTLSSHELNRIYKCVCKVLFQKNGIRILRLGKLNRVKMNIQRNVFYSVQAMTEQRKKVLMILIEQKNIPSSDIFRFHKYCLVSWFSDAASGKELRSGWENTTRGKIELIKFQKQNRKCFQRRMSNCFLTTLTLLHSQHRSEIDFFKILLGKLLNLLSVCRIERNDFVFT